MSIYRILTIHPTTTLLPKVSRGPIVRDLHSKHRTFRSCSWSWVKRIFLLYLRGLICRSGLHARIAHAIVTFWTLTPISLQSSILWHISLPFLDPQRYAPIWFGIKKPSRFKGTGRHFESVQAVGQILAFVLPHQVHTLRQWRGFEQQDKLVREGK